MNSSNTSAETRSEALGQRDKHSLFHELQLLRIEFQRALKREAELQHQLAAAKIDKDFSHTARRAALNLMEDAIAARRAEQHENTERQRVELELGRSDAKFRALFESMSDPCCILEQMSAPEAEVFDFRFVDANLAFRLQSGQPAIEAKSVSQILRQEAAPWLEACQRALIADQPFKFEQQLFEQSRDYEITAFQIRHNDYLHVVMLLTDITERKRAAEAQLAATLANEQLVRLASEVQLLQVRREASIAAQEMEERFRAFIDQNPMSAFIKDEDGRYLFVNNALERGSGRPLAEWLGKTDFDLFRHEDAEQYRRHELVVLSTRSAAQFTESATTEDGRHEYLSFKFSLRDAAGRWFLAGTSFDITQQKRAEEALATNEQRLRALTAEIARAEFEERRRVAAILHEDVQQSLIAMQLRIAMIESQSSVQQTHEHTAILNSLVIESINSIRTLTRDLVPPILYQLGMAAGLEWLANRFDQLHQLHVEVYVEGNCDPRSDMLRDMIFNITRELLLNVVKHAGTDTADVILRREAEFLQLMVCDNGKGFDLQRGWQHRDSFGLFQIRERLYSMGGSLELISAPGQGLEVVALIPIDQLNRSAT